MSTKTKSIPKICLLLVLLFGTLHEVEFAQSANVATQTAPTVEPMRENERIQFMVEQGEAGSGAAREPSSGGLIVRTIGALSLIVGLIFATAWVLKKFNLIQIAQAPNLESPQLSVLENVSLGSNRTLSVVRFGERTLLVGSTAHTISLLASDAKLPTQIIPQSVSDLLAQEQFSEEKVSANADFNLSLAEAENRLDFQAAERRAI